MDGHRVRYRFPQIAYSTYFCLPRELYPAFLSLTWPDAGTFLTVQGPSRELQRSQSWAEQEASSKVPQMVQEWVVGVQARTLAHFCTHHTLWPTLGITTEAGPSLNSQSLFSKAGFNLLHTLPLVSPSFLSLCLLSQLTDKSRLSHIRTNLPRTLCPSGLWFSALGAPVAVPGSPKLTPSLEKFSTHVATFFPLSFSLATVVARSCADVPKS